MYKTIAITLPEDLVKRLEKERKGIGINRSEYFRKALMSFIGIGVCSDDKMDKKYGPLYKDLSSYYKETSDEMMSIASETLPKD